MRVLGVGHCTLDHIGVVERFPEPDFKQEFIQFSTQGGGPTATALVALARWGVETAFVGKVGDDARGEQIEATLSGEGVDTRGLIHEKDAVSQLSFIVVEASSGRKQTYVTGGNVRPLERTEVDLSLIEGASLLLCDGTHLDAENAFMRAAKDHGIPVVLDASRMQSGIHEAVAHSHYLVASERFASQFAGVGELESLCHALLERGPEVVVVTLGNEGSVAMSGEDRRLIRVDPYPVEVVDATGAGDIFHGGFIYGVSQGWDLEKTVRFANVAAGLSCTGIGGRSAIPTADEVLSKL